MEYTLYTFLLDFRGGIYRSQVRARTPQDAMHAWGNSLDVSQIKYMGEKVKQDLLRDLEDEYPIAIDGVVNVWGFAIVPLWRFGMVNFVATVENGLEPAKKGAKRTNDNYTFVFYFQGGTYISQIRSESPHGAMLAWAASLSQEFIPEMNERMKQDLINNIKDMDDDCPSPIRGILNTWKFSVSPLGYQGVGDLILTAEGVGN